MAALSRQGKKLGTRALKKRGELLAALEQAIYEEGWRGVTPKIVCRLEKRSSAVFYTHWPDIEAATMEMLSGMVKAKQPIPKHLKTIAALLRIEGYRIPDLTNYEPAVGEQ